MEYVLKTIPQRKLVEFLAESPDGLESLLIRIGDSFVKITSDLFDVVFRRAEFSDAVASRFGVGDESPLEGVRILLSDGEVWHVARWK